MGVLRLTILAGFCMDGSDGEPDYRFHVTHPERYGNFHVVPLPNFISETGSDFSLAVCCSEEDEELHLVLGTIEQPGEGSFKDFREYFHHTHIVPNPPLQADSLTGCQGSKPRFLPAARFASQENYIGHAPCSAKPSSACAVSSASTALVEHAGLPWWTLSGSYRHNV